MRSTRFSPKDKQTLLKTARHAIQYGLTYHKCPKLELEHYSPSLREVGATFVTLKETYQLRGCIGTLQAYQPIIQDVAEHAFSAAFNDPRFPPVNALEEPMLHISISILTPATKLECRSEAALLEQLRPDIDGLILEYGPHRATFLPAVWEQLPDKNSFLQHLKLKAGLSRDFWHSSMQFSAYQTDIID